MLVHGLNCENSDEVATKHSIAVYDCKHVLPEERIRGDSHTLDKMILVKPMVTVH